MLTFKKRCAPSNPLRTFQGVALDPVPLTSGGAHSLASASFALCLHKIRFVHALIAV